MKNPSDWHLFGEWPTKKKGKLSNVGNYLIVNQSPNNFFLVAINVVSLNKKFYINMCRFNSKLSKVKMKKLKDFKDFAPRHGIQQLYTNSCGYHVILFTMLLIVHGTDLRTLSYSIMNDDKFILTESILS